MTTANKWIIEAAGLVDWNPAWTIEEINDKKVVVEVQMEKLCHLVKRYLKEEHPSIYDQIESKSGDTVYKTLRGSNKEYCRMSMGTALTVMNGDLSADDFFALMDKDWSAKKFPYPFDAGEEWLKKVQAVCTTMYELRQAGVTTTPEVTPPAGAFSLPDIVNEGVKTAINSLLSSAVGKNYDEIRSGLAAAVSEASTLESKFRPLKKENKELAKQVEDMKKAFTDLTLKASLSTAPVEVQGDGTIPDGKVVTKRASEIFEGIALDKDFEVPFWEWDGVHPHVPAVDPNYIFRPKELVRVLYALVTNQRMYLHGHTGSGKTTLIEQVAAHLNWPFVRINFDSEITRMDLIGRDTLSTDEGGKTISKFVDGILPTVMAGPFIACYDELDFVRPDVAYVMQSALEGNQLRITEDGDRIVKPHPMYRMFGTGNTVGQGDEFNMYAGARPQSLAFLDRFTVWLKVNYLDEGQRKTLINAHYPGLSSAHEAVLLKYISEHVSAFLDNKVLQPLSPRGMLALARAVTIFDDVKEAIEMTVLDKASSDDRATLKGIVDRVVK